MRLVVSMRQEASGKTLEWYVSPINQQLCEHTKETAKSLPLSWLHLISICLFSLFQKKRKYQDTIYCLQRKAELKKISLMVQGDKYMTEM